MQWFDHLMFLLSGKKIKVNRGVSEEKRAEDERKLAELDRSFSESDREIGYLRARLRVATTGQNDARGPMDRNDPRGRGG